MTKERRYRKQETVIDAVCVWGMSSSHHHPFYFHSSLVPHQLHQSSQKTWNYTQLHCLRGHHYIVHRDPDCLICFASLAIELHSGPSLSPSFWSRVRRWGLWPMWGMWHGGRKSEGLLPEEGCVGWGWVYRKEWAVRTWGSTQEHRAEKCWSAASAPPTPGGHQSRYNSSLAREHTAYSRCAFPHSQRCFPALTKWTVFTSSRGSSSPSCHKVADSVISSDHRLPQTHQHTQLIWKTVM